MMKPFEFKYMKNKFEIYISTTEMIDSFCQPCLTQVIL